MSSSDGNTRGRGGEMSRLRMLQLQVAEKLREEYLRNGQSSRVNTVWVTLFGYLLDEVREREAELERKYESIWRDKEDYSSKLDIFIATLKNFSTIDIQCDEEIKRRQEDIKKDIEELEKKIEEKSQILGVMSNNLRCLRRSREELLRIRETPEFALLSNWVRATCDRCVEIENEITELKLRISQKNADILEFLGYGHNIFSKVNIEDLKKLPPFITEAEPSTSSNITIITDTEPSTSSNISYIIGEEPSTSSNISYIIDGEPSTSSNISYIIDGEPSTSSNISYIIDGEPSTSSNISYIIGAGPSTSSNISFIIDAEPSTSSNMSFQ